MKKYLFIVALASLGLYMQGYAAAEKQASSNVTLQKPSTVPPMMRDIAKSAQSNRCADGVNKACDTLVAYTATCAYYADSCCEGCCSVMGIAAIGFTAWQNSRKNS